LILFYKKVKGIFPFFFLSLYNENSFQAFYVYNLIVDKYVLVITNYLVVGYYDFYISGAIRNINHEHACIIIFDIVMSTLWMNLSNWRTF